MDTQSVFYEEWLRSLREQYKQVARNDDRVTLSSLTAVMRQIGFRDDELAQLRVKATMHVDDAGADYRADLNILDSVKSAQAHPAECLCPECVAIDESQFDEEGQPIAPDPAEHDYEAGQVFPIAGSGEITEPALAEPVTFEDSVAADALRTEVAEQKSSIDEDEHESDPDAPAQMSLF